MTVFIIISVILALLLNAGILFFLMAIWRAILGKSSIDTKLGVAMNVLTTAVDKSIGATNKNTSEQGEMAKQIRELNRNLGKNE